MARRNSRFVNQKVIIGNKSIQEGDLTDSAKDALGADSDFVKTVENFPGGNISASSINPSAIANQDQLVSSTGALTTGGILTISRDGGNSFMNFDDNSQLQSVDSSLTAHPTPTGFDLYTRTLSSPASPFQGPVPLITSSRIRINLNTPIQNQQDLLHFFNVNAGAETDIIHSVQILDSATENDHDFALKGEDGILYYLNLLDSIPYLDPRLDTAGGDNEVDIINDQRLWEGIKGAVLANGTPEFSHDANSNITTRNTASRLRFRTRKSVPASETGGAPSAYKLTAPEGPLGEGVSSPVYSLVSPRFVYKIAHVAPMQGYLNGYTAGGDINWPGNQNPTYLPIIPSNTSSGSTQERKRQKFPFSGPAVYAYISGGDLGGEATGGAGHSSFIKGYSTGNSPPQSNQTAPGANFFEFAFASDTSSTLHPTTSNAQWGAHASSQQSNTHGYTAGSYLNWPNNNNPTYLPLIPSNSNPKDSNKLKRQKFPFFGPAVYQYISGGNLTTPAIGGAGHSSSTKGYSTGGGGISSNNSYPAQYFFEFSFASDTSSTLHPAASNDQWGSGASSQQSSTHGYTAGGHLNWPGNQNPTYLPIIPSNSANGTNATGTNHERRQKFPFAGPSTYAYISGGDLGGYATGGAGHSSHSKGYITGGGRTENSSAPAANFFEFSFASDTSSTLHPAASNDQWGVGASPQFQ